MDKLVEWTVEWPARMARPVSWMGPLVARIVVGEVFMVSGWIKLHNLPQMIENFTGWGIPFPHFTTPFVSVVELAGGLLLLLGLFTRFAAIPLAVVMAVAIATVLWPDVDSLDTLLGLSESAYLAVFLWLAAAGPGCASVDHVLARRFGRNRTYPHA
jgi:putative oxidoreductase